MKKPKFYIVSLTDSKGSRWCYYEGNSTFGFNRKNAKAYKTEKEAESNLYYVSDGIWGKLGVVGF